MPRAPDPAPETPLLSPSAADEWIRHVESVLRGVAHALNNRGAALLALKELTSESEDPAVISGILASEQARVRDLVQVLRTIGVARGTGGTAAPEAFSPVEVAADVLLVLDQHPDLRDGAVRIDATKAVPVRAPRWAFARTLLALAAGLPVRPTRANPATILVQEDGEWLSVAADAPDAVRATALASELARYMGGEPLADRYGIRLPTLATLRRREGR